MNKIRITPEAARDLQAVQSYIAQDLGNPAAAKRTVKSILQHLRVLERFANAGFSVAAKTGADTDLRILVCGSYLAPYRVEGKTVSIARILHAKQAYLLVLFGEEPEAK